MSSLKPTPRGYRSTRNDLLDGFSHRANHGLDLSPVTRRARLSWLVADSDGAPETHPAPLHGVRTTREVLPRCPVRLGRSCQPCDHVRRPTCGSAGLSTRRHIHNALAIPREVGRIDHHHPLRAEHLDPALDVREDTALEEERRHVFLGKIGSADRRSRPKRTEFAVRLPARTRAGLAAMTSIGAASGSPSRRARLGLGAERPPSPVGTVPPPPQGRPAVSGFPGWHHRSRIRCPVGAKGSTPDKSRLIDRRACPRTATLFEQSRSHADAGSGGCTARSFPTCAVQDEERRRLSGCGIRQVRI